MRLNYLPDPKFINIYLTNECNLNCIHCIDNASVLTREEKSKEMTKEEIIRIIDYYIDRGVTNISFSGGEPMLHPNLIDLVKYVKSRDKFNDIEITLITNATLIDYENAKELKEAGVFYIRTSLESHLRERHDWIRGKGNFDRVINSIKILLEVGFQKVGVATTVRKDNINEIDLLIEFVRGLGVKNITLAPLMPQGRAVTLENVFLDNQEFEYLVDTQFRLEQMHSDINLTIDSPLRVISAMKRNKDISTYAPCVIGTAFLGFKANGDIYACPMRDEVVIGSVRTDDLSDIWTNSELLNRIRNLDMISDKCHKCGLLLNCGAGCRARTHIYTGDVIESDPYCYI